MATTEAQSAPIAWKRKRSPAYGKDDPIVFHDLRHTFGTLGAAIWPLHDLQGYMGHADIQTTMIYVHHVPKVTAADELSRAVASAIGAGDRPLAAQMNGPAAGRL